MKKVLASVIALGCFAAATAYAGIPAGTGVNGSLHDMTLVVGANADSMGRVCVFCHTPHNAMKDTRGNLIPDNYPLWNHDFGQAVLTTYQWATTDNLPFTITDPLAGPSRLCMTCHDGSVAVDQHGYAVRQAGSGALIGTIDTQASGVNAGHGASLGRGNLTGDLTQTHPIGFDYNAAAAARNASVANGTGSISAGGANEIVPSTYGFATAITVTPDLATNQLVYNDVTRGGVGSKTILSTLYGGNIMTCATCHEVHNKENAKQDNYINNALGGDTTGLDLAKAPNYFLYAKESQSLICLSCHVK
jgi:Zn-finger protein